MNGKVEEMRELLPLCKDAAKNRTASRGDTAAHLAVRSRNFKAVKLLVDEFRDDSKFLNEKNDHGDTILHLAVGMKQLKTVKLLLSIPGVNKNAQNCWNITPLDVLNESLEYDQDPNPKSAHDIIRILQQAGAVSGSSVQQPEKQASKTLVDQENQENYFGILLAVFNLLGVPSLDSEARVFFGFLNVMTLFTSLNILFLRICFGREELKIVGFLLRVLMGFSVFFAALTCLADLFMKLPQNYHLFLFILLATWIGFLAAIVIRHAFPSLYRLEDLRMTVVSTLVIFALAASVIYLCMWSSTWLSSANQMANNTQANQSGTSKGHLSSGSESMFSPWQQSQCLCPMDDSVVSTYVGQCLEHKGRNSDSMLIELKYIQHCFAAAAAKYIAGSHDNEPETQEPQSFSSSDATDHDHFLLLAKAIDQIVDKRVERAKHMPPT